MTRIALLIDGENLPAKFAGPVVQKARSLGTLVAARVYGHFSGGRVAGWESAIDALNLILVDVERTSRTKNNTDFKLLIEAMDMLHTRGLDGLCIASSDGDFTALAERIRASAHTLYLFGEKKAPDEYKKLGHAFFDVAALVAPTLQRSGPPAAVAKTKPAVTQQPRAPKSSTASAKPARGAASTKAAGARSLPPTDRIHAAIKKAAGPDGWASSQKIGNALTAADRTFSIRTYAANMKELLGRTSGVETEPRGSETWARVKQR